MIVHDAALAFATTRDSQRRKSDEDAPPLFDAIFASQQIALPAAPPDLRAALDFSPARIDAPSARAISNALPSPQDESTAQEVRALDLAPTESSTDAARSMRHAEPTSRVNLAQHTEVMIHQGTLPVIVAGQLVELTVLRERRTQQDVVARRLTMTLRPASADEVRIDAHLDGDRLVVQLGGAGAADATSCARHADEVRSLAQRLGWTFAEMTWGTAE